MEREEPNEAPSDYEIKILQELSKSGNGHGSKLNKWFKNVQMPFEKAADFLKQMPHLDAIKEKTFALIQEQLEGFKVDPHLFDQVVDRYRDRGYKQIAQPEDISSLHLEDIDPLVKDICQKYQSLASSEDENTSALSLQSMPKDIVALVNLNRKAVSEYAAHYGFDISIERERLFALNILEYAATNSRTAREHVMKRLIDQTKQMTGEGQVTLSKAAFLSMFSTLSSSISIKLLKAKVGEGFPVHGAVIGSGFNAYFTKEVCSAAQFFYKQRFLAKKYGSHVIEFEDLKYLSEGKGK